MGSLGKDSLTLGWFSWSGFGNQGLYLQNQQPILFLTTTCIVVCDVCCPKPEVQCLLSERTRQLTCTKAGGLTTHSPANDLLPGTLLSRYRDEHPGVDSSHPWLQGGAKVERGSLDRELAPQRGALFTPVTVTAQEP